MEYLPLIIVCVAVLFSITRPFTTILHELGHAIPAILLTREKVKVYIGSYGDTKRSLRLNIGLLEVWIKYNPLLWRLGMCVPSSRNISINHQIIYTLAGPVVSAIIAFIACYLTFYFNLHGAIKVFLAATVLSAVIDLFYNLRPSSQIIHHKDGGFSYNDGQQLKQLFQYKRYPEYRQAVELVREQQHEHATILIEKLLSEGMIDDNLYRMGIPLYLKLHNFRRAKELADEFIPFGNLTTFDLTNCAMAYSKLGLHDKAIEMYERSLRYDSRNKYSLNNMGFTYNIVGKYKEAIVFFDKALAIDSNFYYAYNNRGLSKIKTGLLEEGLADINRSLTFDDNNSYAYLNLGIYHFEKEDYNQALTLFKKAQNMDASTEMVDDLIKMTEQKIP